MESLKLEIKKLLIESLELEDMRPEQIDDSQPIFGAGLGLDSIDALELGIAVKNRYGVSFSQDNEENRRHFASVNALAEYIISEGAGGNKND
ncbi:MAG: phosphopantetheine-binding protein [Treponema sp.]|jgi:acyl carrier protein|nr:phosphopantetheine-binding protein [Treponema sp.]